MEEEGVVRGADEEEKAMDEAIEDAPECEEKDGGLPGDGLNPGASGGGAETPASAPADRAPPADIHGAWRRRHSSRVRFVSTCVHRGNGFCCCCCCFCFVIENPLQSGKAAHCSFVTAKNSPHSQWTCRNCY